MFDIISADEKLRCGGIGMYKKESVIGFHKIDEENGYLSNWYPSVFYVDGIKYSSVEQFLMYKKAVTFADNDIASQILETDNPDEIKKLGRAVSGYIDPVWAGVRQIILYEGLFAKFQQNEKLKKKLVGTGTALLAECSKTDKIYGIGISLYDDQRYNPSEWKGLNILGFTLMKVRYELSSNKRENPNRENIDFWFETEKDGAVTLVKSDGSRKNFSEEQEDFTKTKQMLAGWQRAMLYIQEFEIWDATAFGASMSATLGVYWKEIDGVPTALLFTTPQEAERSIYPYLSAKQVRQCRANVDAFYKSKEAQAFWSDFILYPVCLLAKEGSKYFTPVSLEALYREGTGGIDITYQHPVRLEYIEDCPYIFKSNE